MPDDSTCIMLLSFQRGSLSKNLNLNGFSSIKNVSCGRGIYMCACVCIVYMYLLPWWLRGKESTCNAGDTGDMGSILGSSRSPGGGHGNPLHYSCQENPMDRGAWWATVHRFAKGRTWLWRRTNLGTATTQDGRVIESSLPGWVPAVEIGALLTPSESS